MGANRIHDGCSGRNGTAAEIIAIGKAARKHDEIGTLRQVRILMPDRDGVMAGCLTEGTNNIAFAVGTRKCNDG